MFPFFGDTEKTGSFVSGVYLFDEKTGLDHAIEYIDAGGGFEEKVDADNIGFSDCFARIDGMQEVVPFQLDLNVLAHSVFETASLDAGDAAEGAGKA